MQEYQRDKYLKVRKNNEEIEMNQEDLTWIYISNQNKKESFQVDECEYCVDFKKGKLKIVDKKHNIYACISAKRILKMYQLYHNIKLQSKELKTKIYTMKQ